MKYYAGIGSRSTPKKIQHIMHDIAYWLAAKGWVLNSGGADGADLAFQIGCEKYCDDNHIQYDQRQQIFVPWNGFNSLKIRENNGLIVYKKSIEAINLIKELHPNPNSVLNKETLTALMSRNANQILGLNLNNPVKMVICYSSTSTFDQEGNIKDVAGGTGQAVRIAYKYKIPVFNLAIAEHETRILSKINAK